MIDLKERKVSYLRQRTMFHGEQHLFDLHQISLQLKSSAGTEEQVSFLVK